MNKSLTLDEEKTLCELYATTRNAVLAKTYGISGSTVLNILKRHGVKLKPKHVGNKYDFNIHFFDKIDTESKAYFLGLLYADGCHYKKTRQISIELSATDKDILEKMKVAFSSNHPLSSWYRITPVSKTNNQYFTLRMSNEHFSKKCEELGLVERKSLILKPPTEEQVPTNLIHHFIRGYFDGDGSITLILDKTQRACGASIIGTTEFCEWCKRIVESFVKEKTGAVYLNKTSLGLSYYRVAGVQRMLNFLNF